MNPLPAWLQSSVDPTAPSLTIESLGKTLIGLVAMYAASRGLSVDAATSQAQLFVDQAVTATASAFTLYQAVMTLYGLVRKLFMRAAATAAASGATTAATPTIILPPPADAAPVQAVSVPPGWDEQPLG